MFALVLILNAPLLWPQAAPPPVAAAPDAQAAITGALLGRWTGVLEYRDYSEPATSLKRVELPTWLVVSRDPDGLALEYTYDDGPSKTVSEHSVLVLNTRAKSYNTLSSDGTTQTLTITGLEQLKGGLGVLTLESFSRDNKSPAEIRTVWTLRRNLLSWLEEVRASGSSDPFVFRHRYTFTRAEPPSPTPRTTQ